MKLSTKPEPKSPKHQDVRFKKRFALLPKRLTNNHVVWLENFWIEEVYYDMFFDKDPTAFYERAMVSIRFAIIGISDGWGWRKARLIDRHDYEVALRRSSITLAGRDSSE